MLIIKFQLLTYLNLKNKIVLKYKNRFQLHYIFLTKQIMKNIKNHLIYRKYKMKAIINVINNNMKIIDKNMITFK